MSGNSLIPEEKIDVEAILENLESFPDANAGLAIGQYRLEILELEGNVVQAVRATVAAA